MPPSKEAAMGSVAGEDRATPDPAHRRTPVRVP
jgi:hypothetical protein